MKILVRGTNWIGDNVMSVPALKLLRRSFPEAAISLATQGWAEGLYRDADFIDELVILDDSGHSPKSVREQSKKLKQGVYDASLLFTNSFGSALVARLAGIPKRYGYAGEARGFLLTEAFPKPAWKGERHEVYYYLDIAKRSVSALGKMPAESEPDISIPVSAERRKKAREKLGKERLDPSRKIIAFGAGSQNSRAKRWMPDRFAAVADSLSNGTGSQTILLGSKADGAASAEVAKAMRTKALDLTGETELDEAVAVIAESDLLISNDMGLAHVAAAVGTPVVTIFGPTNHLTTAPWGGTVVREPVDCSPCMLRDCPIDHRCMTRVAPGTVIEEALGLLKAE